METYLFKYFNSLWDIIVEMAPWLLLGFLFSGILKAFIPEKLFQNHLGKSNFYSVLKATLLGIPLPLCSCGVIPVASSLHKNGASKGSVGAFLISTPQTGVDSIFATYALLGLPFAIIRPIVAFISGIIGGTILNLFFKNDKKNIESSPDLTIKNNSLQEKIDYKSKIKEVFEYGFYTMVEDLYKWIILGLILASIVSAIIPPDFFSSTLAYSWQEIALVILISVPLYFCATGSIPLAMVLVMKGISPGAILIFLMLGPATNIATITVLSKSIGKKFIIIYLLSMVFCAIFFGQLTNIYFPNIFSGLIHNHSMHNHYNLLGNILAILLIIILIFPLVNKYLISSKNKIMVENQQFNVEGMSCNHCKASIEKNVSKIEGVTGVEVDLNSKKVFVNGTASNQKIIDCIIDLGFDVKK